MLEEAVLRYYEYASGRKRIPFLAERTGISARGLGKGLKKGLRESTISRARRHSEENVRDQLRQCQFSEDEISAWISGHPGTLTAGMIYETEVQGLIEFPLTMALARRIDELGIALISARQSDDFAKAKTTLLDTDWLHSPHFSNNYDEASDACPELLRQAQSASVWSELEKPAAGAAANLLFSLLAQWDIEFQSLYLRQMQRRPVFSLLLPLADIERVQANPRGREPIRFPVSRLIDLLYAMHHRHRYCRWPDTRPGLKDLVPVCNESETNLVNWRDGTKHLSLKNFEQLRQAFFVPPKDSCPPPIMPLYVAAALFQVLLVKVDTAKRGKQIRLHNEEYLYWWNEHLQRMKQAGGVVSGDTPWPAWLSEP
ncbi:hypothetical protein [Denitromonas ohlonensis]|uniref:Uncharacterized protein n=2 Tax=Denitromonas TaxID=139331 RepID=A0A558EX65_9RHOO|nr:hypothetical protein [Denitromonas ohlonensis]TVT46749.1 MAG: hypothetical protein FHP94_16090 [Denitromonas halophila]TVO64211.1 hypothetical protein FHP90_12985 [Denitromonas ohlonensis]TVO76112.1 hypothetical protein FHP89_11660 [Denitromonas ohlonensis]TVT66362.1 MAG: hypothetical protein FHP93_19065 [Denitromonas halophila]TVT77499.1 MAG: hypothetical protein FHP92_04840 [Denitromonas halophila]